MIQHLPNLITLLRLLMVPVMVWLVMKDHMTAAFWVFVAAGVSDAVDGFIAKRFNAETVIGGFLDPLADKALLVCVYVTLGWQEHLPAWLVILVVFRDVLIVGGAILYQVITNTLTMEPILISKVNTTAQILLAGWVLGDLGLGLDARWVAEILIYIVGVTTVASGGVYVWSFGKRAMSMENGR